ncbi:MAG: hypothetical protein PUF71_02050 [Firmicutes bacterium]|nr:hypothetical protein [Bacillota bacterium]
MELQKRKPNRLWEYDYSTNGAYFVTICTQDRRKILSSIVGDGSPVPKPCGIIAEKLIAQIPEKYPTVSVDNYVIMPDHIHMLFRFDCYSGTGNPSPTVDCYSGTGNPSPTLGNVIGWYKYQVTKQVNLQSNNKSERVFQRSYYDHVIRNQRDYDEIWQYIENNPRKWLTERTVYK